MLGDWIVTGERVDTAIHSGFGENIFEIEQNVPESYSPVKHVNW